jgi:putative addiction module component (TIGR02574 family)
MQIIFMRITKEDIRAMSAEERQQLLEMLWESFEDDGGYVDNLPEETDEELNILHERLEEYKKDPSTGIPWEKLKEELMKRHHE